MLSERLRDLEAAGLVQRTVIPSSPPTVEYRLTERGQRLGPIIEAMGEYARTGYVSGPNRSPAGARARAACVLRRRAAASAPSARSGCPTSWPPGAVARP